MVHPTHLAGRVEFDSVASILLHNVSALSEAWNQAGLTLVLTGVDVKHPLRIVALNASIGRRARLERSYPEGLRAKPVTSG